MHKINLKPLPEVDYEKVTRFNQGVFGNPVFKINGVYIPKKNDYNSLSKKIIHSVFQFKKQFLVEMDDFSIVFKQGQKQTRELWTNNIKYIQVGVLPMLIANRGVNVYKYVITFGTSNIEYHQSCDWFETLGELKKYCDKNRIDFEDPFELLQFPDHFKAFEYLNKNHTFEKIAEEYNYPTSYAKKAF